jgi:hypothetical protein
VADSSKLIKLRLQVGADASEDELLLMYLADAEQAILNHLYPMDDDVTHSLPTRYESKQIEIAAYLYSKRGAEGELSHTENGISRSYESGSIPRSMLSDIIPYGSVIS